MKVIFNSVLTYYYCLTVILILANKFMCVVGQIFQDLRILHCLNISLNLTSFGLLFFFIFSYLLISFLLYFLLFAHFIENLTIYFPELQGEVGKARILFLGVYVTEGRSYIGV